MDAYDIFHKLTLGAVFKKQVKVDDKKHIAGQPGVSENVAPVGSEEEVNHFRNKNKINVSGKGVPVPIRAFEDLKTTYKISDRLLHNIRECGYNLPTPIQMQAIPIMLQDRQILACAPTGSGKTASFLIPVIHKLSRRKTTGFRALIVSPTRELARQTHRECEKLCAGTDLKVHIITKFNESVKKLGSDISTKFDILITTPNRLVYILNKEPPILSLKQVQWLIVDESDKLFETGIRGFRDQLAAIYQACDSDNVKRAMFSATHTVEVAKWSRHNLKGLILVNIGHRNTAVDTVEQELIYVGSEEGKLIAIRELIQKGISPPVLIFLQSKERARDLCYELVYDGINVDMIHSDRTQLQRDNVVKAFREGRIWVLICTELMGRGMDFKGVNLVINYDFPPTAISYIHRIGRTGRAGRPGKAVTFYTDEDIQYLPSIVNVMKESGHPIPEHLKQLKRPHKSKRRKLQSVIPERGLVCERPHRYKLQSTKKRKLDTANKNDVDGKKQISHQSDNKKRKKLNTEQGNNKAKVKSMEVNSVGKGHKYKLTKKQLKKNGQNTMG